MMKSKIFMGSLIAVASLIVSSISVSALDGIGAEQDCLINDTVGPPQTNYSFDGNDLWGQTFTPSSAYTLGAVKINIFNRGTGVGTILNVHIVDTLANQPDMNNILATETLSVDSLPAWPGTTGLQFSCDPDFRSSQVVFFDPPVSLGTATYGVILEYSSGPSTSPIASMPTSTFDDFYAGGHQFDCIVPTSCSRNTPATWDLSHGIVDGGYAFFDNVISTAQSPTNQWVENVLEMLGYNSNEGKILIGSIVIGGLVLLLFYKGVPFIFVVMIGGFASVTAFSASLFSDTLLLSAFAVVALALILSVFIPRNSGVD